MLQPDSGTVVSGVGSTPIANVAANDTIDGQPATLGASGNATVASIGTWPQGINLDTMTGAVFVAATVLPGTYVMQYVLCDRNTPANCPEKTLNPEQEMSCTAKYLTTLDDVNNKEITNTATVTSITISKIIVSFKNRFRFRGDKQENIECN